MNKKLELSLFISVTILSITQIYKIISFHFHIIPWDFEVYYNASKAWLIHLNPYDSESVNLLRKQSNFQLTIAEFPYHPYILSLFSVLASLSFHTAFAIYSLINISTSFFLIFLWKKHFPANDHIFLISIFFSFGLPFITCLVDGNPAPIEAFLVWFGLLSYFYQNTKSGLFFLFSAAIIKFTPLILIFIIFLICGKKQKKVFIGFSLIFFLIFFSAVFIMPAEFSGFMHFINTATTYRYFNSSFVNIYYILFNNQDISVFTGLLLAVLWASYVVTTAYFTLKNNNLILKETLAYLMLTYALVSPRWAHYAFIQLLPCAVIINSRCSYFLILNTFIFTIIRFADGLPSELWSVYAFTIIYIHWLSLKPQNPPTA